MGDGILGKLAAVILATLVTIGALSHRASAGELQAADHSLDGVIHAVRARTAGHTLAELRAYASASMRLRGEERLFRLFAVGQQMGGAALSDEADAWLSRMISIAKQEDNRRYKKIGEIVSMSATGGNGHPEQSLALLNKQYVNDPDWFVSAYARGYAADLQSFEGNTRLALVTLREARSLIPADSVEGRMMLALNWGEVGRSLLSIGDFGGGLRARAISEDLRRQDPTPNIETTTLADVMFAALLWRDAAMAQKAYESLVEISRSTSPGLQKNILVNGCAAIASRFAAPADVLHCFDGVDLRSLGPTVTDAQLLVYRALALARIGRSSEARSDLARLEQLYDAGLERGSVPTSNVVVSWLQARSGNGVAALESLEAFDRAKDNAIGANFRHAAAQLTHDLQEDLDLARRNEQQQQTIILFQWALGGAAAMICAAALGVLVWQRRLNRQLVAANARAEAEQRRAEEANAMKSQFLANVSHEVRTPLNGVLGMIQAMAADELSPRQRERLEVLRGSSRGMLTILNDLLDLAKIEAGKLTLESVEFDLAPVVEGSRHAFWAAAEAKGIGLELAVAEDTHGVYRGDPTRLRQIVDNLVSNAIKFTAEGGVQVSFDRSDEMLRLTVRDTGIGMTPEAAAKVFAKYEQAEASTARKYGGTGLGLSICRELVQAFGGEIGVESVAGQGTTFTATLPLQRIGDSAAISGDADAAEAAALDEAGGGLRILAAEDHPVNQLVLRTLLSQLGCEVTLVGDGAEAVEAFRSAHWDVVLLDIQMPNMDGLQATRAIRALEQVRGALRTPLVALTANAMPEEVAEYRAAGFDEYLSKPIDAGELVVVLNRALSGPMEAELRETA
jgi:signal transduction histidine kinase/ActR/RegA family two-component response regulator